MAISLFQQFEKQLQDLQHDASLLRRQPPHRQRQLRNSVMAISPCGFHRPHPSGQPLGTNTQELGGGN